MTSDPRDSGRRRGGRRRLALIGVAVALAGAVALVVGGCNYIAAAVILTQGRGKIPAAYTLDKNRTTVVLIDDLSNRVPRRSLRDDMGAAADAEMLAHGVIADGKLISSASARRAAASDTADDRQAAVDIGRAVGAEVVIYVTMTGWTLQQEPGFISPAASAQVSVLDTVNNMRLWPQGERTHPFVVRVPRASGDMGMSLSEKSKWERTLATRFGTQLGKLFYEHEKESLSQQTRPGLN